MNRHDTIELILEHAIQRGQYSGLYMEQLCAMSDTDLDLELDRLEQEAIFGMDEALARTLANPALLPVLKRLADK